jgi:hypothetical protein
MGTYARDCSGILPCLSVLIHLVRAALFLPARLGHLVSYSLPLRLAGRGRSRRGARSGSSVVTRHSTRARARRSRVGSHVPPINFAAAVIARTAQVHRAPPCSFHPGGCAICSPSRPSVHPSSPRPGPAHVRRTAPLFRLHFFFVTYQQALSLWFGTTRRAYVCPSVLGLHARTHAQR